MPDVLRIKRRASGAVGAPTALANAELAFNEQDNTLYYGKGNSAGLATAIIPIAGQGAFLPLAGGIETGHVTFQSGIDFNNAVASSPQDTSQGITLWSQGVGSSYGFAVTSNTLNYNTVAGWHDFYSSSTLLARIGNGELTSWLPLNVQNSLYVTGVTQMSSPLFVTAAPTATQAQLWLAPPSGTFSLESKLRFGATFGGVGDLAMRFTASLRSGFSPGYAWGYEYLDIWLNNQPNDAQTDAYQSRIIRFTLANIALGAGVGLTLDHDPTANLGAATKQYVDNHAPLGGPYLPLAGGNVVGATTFSATGVGAQSSPVVIQTAMGAYTPTVPASKVNWSILELAMNGANLSVTLDAYGGSPFVNGRTAEGAFPSNSPSLVDRVLFGMRGYGWSAAGFSSAERARIHFAAAEPFTDTAQGAYISFLTTPIGSVSAASEVARLSNAGATFSVPVALPADPTTALGAVTKQYVDNHAPLGGPYLPIAGGTLSGGLVINAYAGQWSTSNLGQQLLVTGFQNNAIGIGDSSNANYIAIANSGGAIYFASMPLPGNSTTAPVGLLNLSKTLASFFTPISFGNGVSFGQVTEGAASDTSRHITLYDSFCGLGVTGGRMNIWCAGSTIFNNGADLVCIDGSNGLYVYSGYPTTLGLDPTAAMHAATKQYSDRNKQRGLVDVSSNAVTMSVANADWAYLYVYGSPTAPSTITLPVATSTRILWTFNNTTSQPTTIQGASGGTVTIPGGGSQGVWTDTGGIYPLYISGQTRAPGDNTTFFATTAFVQNTAGNFLPLAGGTVTGQTSFTAGLLFSGGVWQPGMIYTDTNWGCLIRGHSGANADIGLAASNGTTYFQINGAGVTTVVGPAQFQSTVALAADPTLALQAATKQYVDNNTITPAAGDARWVNVTGDVLSGGLSFGATTVSSDTDLSRHLMLFDGAATHQYGFNVQLSGSNAPHMNFLAGIGAQFQFLIGNASPVVAINSYGVGMQPGFGLWLSADPTQALQAATMQYVDAVRTLVTGSYLPLVGGTLSGALTVNSNITVSGTTTLNGPVSVYNTLATSGTLTAGGLLIAAANISTPPAPGGSAVIAWNYSQGQGEVDFFNTYNSGSNSFAFHQVTGSGTTRLLTTIDWAGNLYLHGGGGVAYSGLSGGGNQMGFSWNGGLIHGWVDGNDLGGLALNSSLGNYLSLGGGTVTGVTWFSGPNPQINIDGPVNTWRTLQFYTSGAARWNIQAEASAEPGGDVGSDLLITRWQDNGAPGAIVRFSRSTGQASFSYQANFFAPVRVSIPDSAGTALLVSGTTKGVRFNPASTGMSIEGVDNTGVGSYQPLTFSGSAITIAAPSTHTGKATFQQGIWMNNSVQSVGTDLSQGIDMYGGAYGFSVTGGTLNIVAGGALDYYPNGGLVMRMHSGGLQMFAGDVTLLNDPSQPMHATTRRYVDGRIAPLLATIAALRAATSATLTAPEVMVQSYAGTTNKGGGRFLYVSTDTTSADNGGTVIVDASSRRWYREQTLEQQPFNAEWFGAVGDGTTNDAPPINAAIAALPASGGVVELPARQFAIASTINLGNGSPSGIATRGGVVLRGIGGIMSPSLLDATVGIGTQLVWTGASGGTTTMVMINGPVQGCGVQNMLFQGNNAASVGLQLTAASFGDFNNLSFMACRAAPLRLYTNASGTSANSMNNRFHNIFIRIMDLASAAGILLDSPKGTQGNPCYNDFENLFIMMAATQLSYGIYLKLCDSNSFRNVLILGQVGMNASSIGVLFDYTSAAPDTLFPCANVFYGIDSRGLASANFIQWANAGTPQNIAAPNYIHGLMQGNSATVPNSGGTGIANLGLDSPVLFYQEWLNYSGNMPATNAYLVWTDGLYSIDYCLVSFGGAAAASTIQPVFGATLTGTFTENFSGPTVYIDNSHVGFTSSGRFTAHCAGSSWISVQTIFTGSGTPQFNLYMNVTRIR